MKKIYLPLFAAAVLASCSNEMDEFAKQTGSEKGYKVDLTIADNQPETRITWGEVGAPVWEQIDKFSVMKIGAQNLNEDFKVVANAAYTTENGANFTSENVLFVGQHVLVYPLQENIYNLNQRVELTVGTDGDKGLGANSVFLGTKLLNITESGEVDGGKVYNDAGYHKKIKVGVRAANAGFIFDLNEVNALPLEAGDPAVEITKVELKNKANTPFAKAVTLQTPTAGGEGVVLTKAINLTGNAYSTYEGLALNGENNAEIAVLPSQATSQAAGNYEIVISTNYGIVTVDKAIDVTKDGKIQTATGLAELTETNKTDDLSFADEIGKIIAKAISGEAMPRVKRTVNVDMTTADINGLEIKNSAQLIAAYRAYDLMGKKTSDNINFKLQGTDGKFELTMDAIAAINRHALATETAATLVTTGITEFTITGTEGDEFTYIPAIDQIGGTTIILADGNKWGIDVKDAAVYNNFTNVINNGELQIKQGNGSTALGVQITNNNAVSFDGAEVTVPTLTSNGGTVTIAEGQTVKMNNGTFNDKTIVTVNGELISNNNINILPGAIVDVYGKLLNQKSFATVNKGTINIKNADAQVILSANGAGSTYGVVNVIAKDNNLNTGNVKGYVKMAVAEANFTLNTANMGIANYVEFSGSALAIETTTYGMFVELQSNVKVTATTDVAKVVSAFIVNENVEATIADGSVLTCGDVINNGKIYNYGQFKFPVSVTKKGTIYDL